MTAPTSVYPRTVDDLLPAARVLREQTGGIPSRNRLMREYRIGAPKADDLRGRLIAEHVQAFEANLTGGPADLPPDPWALAEPVGPDPLPDPPVPGFEPVTLTGSNAPADTVAAPAPDAEPQVTVDGHPGTHTGSIRPRLVSVWPVILLALPAFVAVWSGWVGLGRMTGFGMVDLLPGIVGPGSWATIDSAITLPVGVETYAAYALYVWLSGRVPDRARKFAKWSAIGSLGVGSLGQVAYHLLVAANVTSAPWQITTAVACLPVAVLGMGAALAHLVREQV